MIYTAKNTAVLSLVSSHDNTILDVGCGSGSNAEVIKKRFPNCKISGISNNSEELKLAKKTLDEVFLINLDQITKTFTKQRYDLIICSHVIEHLYNPKRVLDILSARLNPNGRIIVVVPNFAIWPSRIRLLLGKFEYEDSGLYDRTHIRFFTYYNLIKEAVPHSMDIRKRFVTGHFPLPFIRKFLPNKVIKMIDNLALNYLPNMFGSELGLILENKKHN